MRHKRKLAQLALPTDQRLAVLRGAVSSLIKHGKIKMTLAKAKAVKIVAEKLITKAKQGDVSARREAYKVLGDRDLVKTLFDMSSRFADRPGGYTRLTKIGVRKGDASPVALIEFVA